MQSEDLESDQDGVVVCAWFLCSVLVAVWARPSLRDARAQPVVHSNVWNADAALEESVGNFAA